MTTKLIWNASSLDKGIHVADTLIEWQCDASVDYVEIYHKSHLIGRSYSRAFMLPSEYFGETSSISLCPFGRNRAAGDIKSLSQSD